MSRQRQRTPRKTGPFGTFGLYLMVNIAYVVVIGAVYAVAVKVTGVSPLDMAPGTGAWGLGLNLTSLALMCGVWGMAGSFFSLCISKWLMKRLLNFETIDADSIEASHRRIYQKVHELASQAGLKVCPEVIVYESEDANAFATGRSRKSSLVAVSSALIEQLTEQEVDGVLAHEIAHIANGDMVAMTLLQGIVNSFVFFFGYIITAMVFRKSGDNNSWKAIILRQVLYVVLSILSLPIIMWFSRKREFRADLGGAQLAGTKTMVMGLKKLLDLERGGAYSPALRGRGRLPNHERDLEPAFRMGKGRRADSMFRKNNDLITSIQISGPTSQRSLISRLYASHPPLEERIARLMQYGL